jgi:transposase
MVRYLRLTRYIYIRGGGYYIDLEPRRMIETGALLEHDNASAIVFETAADYTRYISDYNAYTLPFETPLKLREIASKIIAENTELAHVLNLPFEAIPVPNNIDKLKAHITELRENRNYLQGLALKQNYQAIEKIDEAIDGLTSTLTKKTPIGSKPSVELEKWMNIALNILNDAIHIKPKVFGGFKVPFGKSKKVQGARIVPHWNNLVIEVIYRAEVPDLIPDNGRYMSLDLGMDNFAAITSNVTGFRALALNGKGLKSMNLLYNKRRAHYSEIADRLGQGKWTATLQGLAEKRNRQVLDFMHKYYPYR